MNIYFFYGDSMKPSKIWTWCGSSTCMDRFEHNLDKNGEDYVCVNCGSVVHKRSAKSVIAVQKFAKDFESRDRNKKTSSSAEE